MTKEQRFFLLVAAVAGAAAVGLGAFGAHGLQTRVGADMLAVWDTAVRYQFFHTLALFACAVAEPLWRAENRKWSRVACGLWGLGMLIFSGTLYALVLSDLRILGAITPIGGVLLIAGWVALALAALKIPANAE